MRLSLTLLLVFAPVASAAEPLPESAEMSRSTTERRATPEQLEFFETKVRPLLAAHCHKCHGPDKQRGELRLDSRAALLKGGESGPVVISGKPAESELIAAVNYGADSYQMPPDGKLKPEQIAALTKWVKLGLPWPNSQSTAAVKTGGQEFNLAARAKHWSFQPVQPVSPPAVDDKAWGRNPIDRFVLARLEQAGLKPAPPADKRTLLRRLSYDLTGLPPTVAELHAFLADESPTAVEVAVDRMLASPRYGERWARHWLDLVRFAETGGHEFDYEIPHAWPYRDYVIRAFNQDLPYDRFVIEQIAGDLLETPRRRVTNGHNESVIGTAFYWFGQGKHSPVDIRAEECDTIANQIDVLGKTFLGLTIACARCHDHKFDPIRAADFYALAGYLQSSRRQIAILDDPAQTEAVVEQITELKQQHRGAIQQDAADRLGRQLDEIFALLTGSAEADEATRAAWEKYLQETAAKDRADVFHPWATLRDKNDPPQFAAAREELVRQLRKLSGRNNAGTTLFAGFDGKSFDDWFVSGPAFGQHPTRNGDVVWHEPFTPQSAAAAEVTGAGWAHSGLMSSRLEGTLHSPTFTIRQPFIFYRAKRTGGKPNPGRQVKNGQLHLIVDGFQYIKSPLYGGLTINVPHDGRWRWFRHDASRFLGSNAYLEIEDADGGSIVIDQIVFSDTGQSPAAPPNSLLVALLDDPAVTSPAQFADRYRQLFADTLRLWQTGRLRQADRAAERIALVNWLLKHGSQFAPGSGQNEPHGRIADVLEQYRLLSTSLRPAARSLAMTDGNGENEYLLVRGNHKQPGREIERRFLEVFAGTDRPAPRSGSGRLHLAHALVDPDNPLTARVLVNRLWLHHFGRGLVASPDNFGLQGQPPSHPQLLDWLAHEFIDSGWSIKHMHRLMVLSSTYRMSSRIHDAEAERADPENALLHRMNMQRLEGEAIRDSLLALSGRLNEKQYGPGVLPHLTPFMEGRGRPSQSGPLDGNGRRSIYLNVRRNFLTPLFLAFDLPTPSTTVGRRGVSNVPAQALTMMNDPFVVQQARLWAERTLQRRDQLAGQAGQQRDLSSAELIGHLYESAFSRLPTDEELAAALAFLDEQGREYGGPDDPRTWADLCHVLLNVKEFLFVN